MTKLEDLKLDDLLTNADKIMDDPFLRNEIASLMNSDEIAKLNFLAAKALALRTRYEEIEKKGQELKDAQNEIIRLTNKLLRLKKEQDERLEPIEILNNEVDAVFNQAIERIKLEKYKN